MLVNFHILIYESRSMHLRLVIYDRKVAITENLQELLRSVGHEIIYIREDKEELKKYIRSIKPHIVIVTLDKTTVNEVLSCMEDVSRLVHVGIIYLSNTSEDYILKKIAITKFIHFLIWPGDSENLLSAIKLSSYRHKLFILSLGGGYTYNPHTKELFFKDSNVTLTNNESKLLYLLVQARGNIVSKELIDYEIWSTKIVHPTTIRTLVHRVRKKAPLLHVEKVSNIGYRLIKSK